MCEGGWEKNGVTWRLFVRDGIGRGYGGLLSASALFISLLPQSVRGSCG